MESTAKKPNAPYMLVNITEELVREKVGEMMASQDMCRCEKCYYDACAIALNALKPCYVTTEKGSLLSLLSAQHAETQTELTVCVLQALLKVKSSPRH